MPVPPQSPTNPSQSSPQLSVLPQGLPQALLDPVRMEIHGVEVLASRPYLPGHICSEVEAEQLNLARRENIRNIISRRKRTREGFTPDDIIAQFLELDLSYSFSLPKAKADPIQQEAEAIALTLIDSILSRSGRSRASMPKDVVDAAVADLLEAKPEIFEEAKARLENAKAVMDSLVLGQE